jgi:hypothetical protein
MECDVLVSRRLRVACNSSESVETTMSTLAEFLNKDLPRKEPLVEGMIYRRDNCTLVGRGVTARRRLSQILYLH